MSAIMYWDETHTHPQGSWWQFGNDEKQSLLTFAGLGFMAVIATALCVWAVLAA